MKNTMRMVFLIFFAQGVLDVAAQPVNFNSEMDPVDLASPPVEQIGAEVEGGMALRNFGPADAIPHWVSAANFVPRNSNTAWSYPGVGYISRSGGTNSFFWAPLDLPHGALIVSMRLFFFDNSAAETARAWLTHYTGNSDFTDVATVDSSNVGGYGSNFVNIFHTLNNYPSGLTPERNYVINVRLPNTSNVRFKGVRVWWRRQLSPSPATATFFDVSTFHPFFKEVEALADSGITGGCGGGNYCPNAPVTRGQMAAFLARALGLHWAVP
jgi:hypothetical protein